MTASKRLRLRRLIPAAALAGLVWLAWLVLSSAGPAAPADQTAPTATGIAARPAAAGPAERSASATAAMVLPGASRAALAREERPPDQDLALLNKVQFALANKDPALAVAALKSAFNCRFVPSMLAALETLQPQAPRDEALQASLVSARQQMRECQTLSAAERQQLPALAQLALRARAPGIGAVLSGFVQPEDLDRDELLAAREVLRSEIQHCSFGPLDTALSWAALDWPVGELELYRQTHLQFPRPPHGPGSDDAPSPDDNPAPPQVLSDPQRAEARQQALALLRRCGLVPSP